MKKRTPGRKTSTSHRKHVANELASLERQLLAALQQRLSRARSVSAHDPTEFLDMASDSELDDLAARIAESDSAKIVEIEEALKALYEGTYGICQGCGDKIPKRRLKVRPFATLCVACKQRQEQHGASTRRPTTTQALEAPGVDVGVGDLEDEGPVMDELFRDVESSDVF